MDINNGKFKHEQAVVPGTPYFFEPPAAAEDQGIVVAPAVGGTALVEGTYSSLAEAKAGTAIWVPWGAGAVTATTPDTLTGQPQVLRITATTQPCLFQYSSRVGSRG